MTIDTPAIRDRVTSRAFGWSQSAGAPEAVRQAAAAYQAAVADLDDALVEYDVEVSTRSSILKQHNDAVTEALRDGKLPPKAKVPSLEEIEVRHGAIIGARESFVHEAAAAAERVAREHYPQWRAEAVEQLQAAAGAVQQVMTATAQAVDDWGRTVQLIARLDRNWSPRTAKLDGASVLDQIENWKQRAGVESTDMGNTARRFADRIQQFTTAPIVDEYIPDARLEQYSAGYLAEQSPATRADMERRSAASVQVG